jgi:hypothetical protein
MHLQVPIRLRQATSQRGSCRQSWWESSRWPSSPKARGSSSSSFRCWCGAWCDSTRNFRAEASVPEMSHTESPVLERHLRLQILVFVDTIGLAEIEAVRLGYRLHADELTAVHFVIDVDHAMRLRERWDRFEHDPPFWLINCPHRQLSGRTRIGLAFAHPPSGQQDDCVVAAQATHIVSDAGASPRGHDAGLCIIPRSCCAT